MLKLIDEKIKISLIDTLDLIPLNTELSNINGIEVESVSENLIKDVEYKLTKTIIDIAILPSVSLLNNYELLMPVGVSHQIHSINIYLTFNQDSIFLSDIIKKRIEALKEISQHINFGISGSIKKSASFIFEAADNLPLPKIDFAPSLKILTSNTSAIMLAKIFYKLIFGTKAYEALVSKDDFNTSSTNLNFININLETSSTHKKSDNKKHIDLIQFWNYITGLPFVSSIMLKNPDFEIPLPWYKKIFEAIHIAQVKMKIEPSAYSEILNKFQLTHLMEHNNIKNDAYTIWKNIKYKLTESEIKGLLMFLCLAKHITKLKTQDLELTKLLRWKYTDKAYINEY